MRVRIAQSIFRMAGKPKMLARFRQFAAVGGNILPSDSPTQGADFHLFH
jgi:hypothetical protein